SSRKDLGSLEIIVGTFNPSQNDKFFINPDNVDRWVKCLKSTMGSNINKVKTILFGNEINCAPYISSSSLPTILQNFKTALSNNQLGSIPITVSFNMLPTVSPPSSNPNKAYGYVDTVKNNWNKSWSKKAFVFADPYPDLPLNSAGTGAGENVYDKYNNMVQYWNTQDVDVYILETGAQGSSHNTTTVNVVNDIVDHLVVNNATPMFIFEAVNEPHKPASPNQQYMGIFNDTTNGITGLKTGITIPGIH
ncbi:MAG: hypothetical protein GY756_00335, partial [bacterium]|nr:hypothetical protein [bacterium]